mgnify:CR=1 FL=1
MMEWLKKLLGNSNDAEVKKLAPSLPESKRAEAVAAVASRMGYSSVEDMYNTIGYGELPVTKTLRRLKDELDAMTPPEIPEEVAATLGSLEIYPELVTLPGWEFLAPYVGKWYLYLSNVAVNSGEVTASVTVEGVEFDITYDFSTICGK